MLGRVAELNYLNELYESEKFEFLVMYGRRRVGKTTLLQEFSKHTNAIFFPAREKNDALNLKISQKQYNFILISNLFHHLKAGKMLLCILVIEYRIELHLLLMNFHISLKKTLLLNHFYNMPLIIAGRIKISF